MAETKAWSDAEKYGTISVFIEKSIEKLPKITRRLNAIGYGFYSVEYASDFLEECQKCSWQKTIKKNIILNGRHIILYAKIKKIIMVKKWQQKTVTIVLNFGM